MPRLYALLKAAYAACVLGVLGWVLWRALADPDTWRYPSFGQREVLFVTCWILMAAVLGWAWARVVRAYLGVRLPVSSWLPLQGAAWAGRYLPGKLGLLAGRMTLLPCDGITAYGLTFSVLVEQIMSVVAGSLTALISPFPIRWLVVDVAGFSNLEPWLGVVRLVLALLACGLAFVVFNILARRLSVDARPDGVTGAIILSAYLGAHMVCGLGFYTLLGDSPLVANPSPWDMVALFAAANVAGMLAFFAPAGLGVREAVLTAGLSPYLSVKDALLVATVARALTLIADATFVAATTGVSIIQRARNRARATVGDRRMP